MKRGQILVAMAVVLIGCGGPPPPTHGVSPPTEKVTPSASGSATTVPISSPPSTARPSPQLSAVAYIDSDDEVLFSGDMAAFMVGVSTGPPAGDLLISEATVDFGDGTTAAVAGA